MQIKRWRRYRLKMQRRGIEAWHQSVASENSKQHGGVAAAARRCAGVS